MSRPRINTREEKLNFKERVATLRNLPRFFMLVWETSPWMMIANSLLRLLKAIVPVVLLYVGKLIIDQVVLLSQSHGAYPQQYLWMLVGAEFALAIISDVLTRGIALMDNLLGDRFSNHTSVKIMAHAATLDLDQFEDSEFYDKMERARQQTTGRTMLLSQVMSQVQDLVTMVFLAGAILTFNPWLFVLLLVAVIPAFLGESHFNNKSYVLGRQQTADRRELDYVRFLGASDETAKEVKIFNLSGFIIDRFHVLSGQFYEAGKRLATKRFAWGAFFAMVGSAGYYCAYFFIILKTVNGNLTIGTMTFLAGSFRQLRSLLEGVLSRFTSVAQGSLYLRDFFEFFEIRPKIIPLANAKRFPNPIRVGFTFENVGFKYVNSDKWANRHLSFTLHVGEKLALVGENGAGKTTLVKLLARLYDPTEGRILLDGIDLKEYDLAELRMQIGVIFQDYLRYQMSLAQNIAAGNIEQKEDRNVIIAAAKQSIADKLAERLPNKYDQALGRRFNDGIELSGGEWQKVALARAYMKDAQLIILDEPTAALDARAEYEVFQRFSELTKNKSAVLISHRFSTVRMADRILVLDKGEIVEIGSHEDLLNNKGRYAELFELQAAGYK